MKKMIAFLLVIVLFGFAAALVLSLPNPEAQERFMAMLQDGWEASVSFTGRLAEAFRIAFSHG